MENGCPSFAPEACVCPPPRWSPQCNPGKALHSNGLGGPSNLRDVPSQTRSLRSKSGPKIATVKAPSMGYPCMGHGTDEHELTQDCDKATESQEVRPCQDLDKASEYSEGRPCKIPIFQRATIQALPFQSTLRPRPRAASMHTSPFNLGRSEVAAVIPRQDDSEGHACAVPLWPSERPGRGFFLSESERSLTACLATRWSSWWSQVTS